MRFDVKLIPEEDGWYIAEVPSLPGCITQGSSREDALRNIKDAIEGWLRVRVMRHAGESELAGIDISGVEAATVEV
jgi:predicted RNase H-like HicB family nuclease